MHRARTRRRFAVGAYLALLAGSIPYAGVPWSRDLLSLWLLGALVVLSVGDWGTWGRRILVEWAPLLGVLLIYDVIRGFADDVGQTMHVEWMIIADKALWGGEVPTVWLQRHFFDPASPAPHDFLAWAIYTSHFFVTLTVLVVLWRYRHAMFRRFAPMVIATTLLAFVGYVVHPAAPPWLAADFGYIEPVTRHAWSMWLHVGVDPAATIFQGGSTYANDVAAIPSLHAAYPALLALFFWSRSDVTMRVALVTYTLLMALTLMYTAEHYLVDILLGWLTAGVGWGAVIMVTRWHAPRRMHITSAPAPIAGVGERDHAVH